MENDRELLELAEKAAGLVVDRKWQAQRDSICEPETASLWIFNGSTAWNPLKNDGDALRLAVKLKLHMLHNDNRDAVLWVSAVLDKTMIHGVVEFVDETDRQAATRRAIVRAAAEIGRAMQSDKR